MIFEKDGTTVTLDQPAQYPYAQGLTLVQASEMSASGITHVEDFEVKTGTFVHKFSNTSDADYSKILDWFLNTAEGKMYKFNLTDDLGVTRAVRFTESQLNFTKDYYQLWSGSFTVEEQV